MYDLPVKISMDEIPIIIVGGFFLLEGLSWIQIQEQLFEIRSELEENCVPGEYIPERERVVFLTLLSWSKTTAEYPALLILTKYLSRL